MDGDLISVWMQKMYAELNISSCKIDVYEEIERYGGIELINYAEKFFYSDSLYVMQLLKCQKNDKKYEDCKSDNGYFVASFVYTNISW